MDPVRRTVSLSKARYALPVDDFGVVTYILPVPAFSSSSPEHRLALDYVLFGAACLLLGVAWLAIHVVPFRHIVRWMDGETASRTPTIEARRICLAVDRAQRRVPWRSVCIDQGITAHVMLRLAGHRSQFVFGMASLPDLAAHVWVRVDGLNLVGSEAATDCVEIIAVPLSPGT